VQDFHARLDALSPGLSMQLRSLGPDCPEARRVATVDLLIRRLDRPERLVSALAYLGRRHGARMPAPDDLDLIRVAMLGTLEHMGRIDLSWEHRAAWNEAFLLVGRILRRMAVVLR
jgi:hypothetical protein